MGSEIEIVEERLKSFTGQLQTECGILERLVYKHKNQHRRCSYFQYILKVRRDLKLLKLANMEDILEASFLVINGNRPKHKVQLLESLKRRKRSSGKYNFLERLLGVTRLLSQMVEPLLKAAMEISTLLAQSFFMKFSLTVLAVLARIRVLIQQMLLDAVLLYNTVSSLSQTEQTVKLNQEGFEVFREYYPRKEEATVMLECIWQVDKYVLTERTNKNETTSQEKDDHDQEDCSSSAPKILYENIEVLLGVDESGPLADAENRNDSGVKNEEKSVQVASDTAANINSLGDVFSNSSIGMEFETTNKELVDSTSISSEAGLPASSSTPPHSCSVKKKANKRVAFIAVKPPAPTTNESSFHQKGHTEEEWGR
ncbi:hypothetical protein ACS0TY_017153 [Phlomoides rotata]